MIVTIYFYKYPNGTEQNWKFFHPEFNMGKLSDFVADIYKFNEGCIIKEINIQRV